jgi:hypothetical protein
MNSGDRAMKIHGPPSKRLFEPVAGSLLQALAL